MTEFHDDWKIREARERLRKQEEDKKRREHEERQRQEHLKQQAHRRFTGEKARETYGVALATLRSEHTWTALCEGLGLHSSVRPYSRRNANGTSTIVHEEMYPSVDRVGVTPKGLQISITNAVGVGSDQWKAHRRDLSDALGFTDLDIQQDGPTITLLGKAKPAGQ